MNTSLNILIYCIDLNTYCKVIYLVDKSHKMVYPIDTLHKVMYQIDISRKMMYPKIVESNFLKILQIIKKFNIL